jgi:uncharacterized membrane protein YdjX (TVP38/TMEM64 family)
LRLIFGICLAVIIFSLAALAYSEQDALLRFIDENISTLPPYISALMIIAWVGIGTIIFIPNTVLFVTSGTLFGFWWAFTFNIIGFGIGSTLAFLISRHGFYDFVRSRTLGMLQTFNHRFSDSGWKSVAVVRLTPVFPSFAVNYLLGITHVRFFDYVWASILFTVPACLIFTYLGDASITLLLESGNSESLKIITPIVVVIIVAAVVHRIRKKRATNAQ